MKQTLANAMLFPVLKLKFSDQQLTLDLEQEKSSHSVQNQELLNHISKLNQQRGEMEAKIETLLKSQSNSKQNEDSLKAAHDQMKAQQFKFEETRVQLQQQVDSLHKQLKESQTQLTNAAAKAQQEQATSKQQELSKQNEIISRLQEQLRSVEANIADKDRVHEETLKQERLRAAQTVASVNSRCELLQKQLEEAQVKLTFEKNQSQGEQNPSSSTHTAEVATLKAMLADAERKAESALEQLQERDARIVKLADELKTAMQRQLPSSPQPSRPSPAVKPEQPQPYHVLDSKHTEELVAALDVMQQNRSALAKELAKEMVKSTSLVAQVASLQTTVKQLYDQLGSLGAPLPPISSFFTLSEETEASGPSSVVDSPAVLEPAAVSDTTSEIQDVEPMTPKKSAPVFADPATPEIASASSRLPPPSAAKPDTKENTQDSQAGAPKSNSDRGSWSLFGRIWGGGPKPPPTKQNGSAQVIV